MKIIQSKKFQRQAAKLVSGNKLLLAKLLDVYKMLEVDVFNPKLKTHKLKGELEGYFSCSLTQNLRIVFKLESINDEKTIILLTVGNHDEVY